MSEKKEIFLIPYAHLDTQWRWEYPTTIKKYILSTLEENIALFEKYPEHRFNFTGAIRYAMMKEYYPALFQKIRPYIDDGRWNFAGTCLDETDPLSPSVESLIRNILYGDRWAKAEWGKSSRDYMLPDCFGFPANMPTILAHCGLHGFSTQKLTWNSAMGIPFELGIWTGPDGSEVLSAFNPGSYAAHLNRPIQHDNSRMQKLTTLGTKNGVWKSFQYYGVGDIGGAPTEGSVKQAIASMQLAAAENTGLVIRQGSTDQFFNEITPEERSRLDHYTGDLLLINHSAGTLTSATIMKRWNRKNEQMAFAAETAAVMALELAGLPYPDQKIKSAWYRTIGNQMHDILPGTSTPLAYEYSHNDEVVALNTWVAVLHDAAQAIAPYIKGKGDILLFNPLGETRKEPLLLDLPSWDANNTASPVIVDAEGKSYPVQIRKTDTGTYQALFIPELKPLEWSRYSLSVAGNTAKNEIPNAVSLDTSDGQYIMENAYYRVTVTKDGKIASVFQKNLQQELLKAPVAYEFQAERPMLYPAWNMDWADRKKPPFHRIDSGTVTILEKGPLRCTLQIISNYKKSQFVKEVSLSHDSKIVEFVERIHWRGSKCSLKLALTANMDNPKATFNWETSRLTRGVNSEKLFEMPSRYWADLGTDAWGVSIIEDSKYGYDRPMEDTLRLTLIYTPGLRYATGFWDQKWHDWGDHTIRYGLFVHEGGCTETDQLARAFNQPIRTFRIHNEIGSAEKKAGSLFTISNPQLGLLAVKKPEDTDGILIRLYERHGTAGQADLTFMLPIKQVTEVNGLEEKLHEVPCSGNKFTVKIEANQIRSYIVVLKNSVQASPLKQEALKLEYNAKMIGPQGDSQALFPAELTPSTIQAGPISFTLATQDSLNTLQCKGQVITIPDDVNSLSILIGATEECNTVFKWVDHAGNISEEVKCHVSALTGYRGQWDRRLWLRKPTHYKKYARDYAWINVCTGVQPGFVNRDRIEWYATHTHKNGEDQPYHYGYMTNITIPIPKGAKTLMVPRDARIYIFAMTAGQQGVDLSGAQVLRDKYDF
jgi:alpha-mannosidase